MSGRRTIVVNGREWKYNIGRQFVVAKATDTGKGIRGSFAEVTHMRPQDIEHDQWKRTFHITPQQIAAWIALED